MVRFALGVVVVAVTLGTASSASAACAPSFTSTLVFSDEFDGASLDRTKWCTRYSPAGGPALQVADAACQGPDGWEGTLDHLNDEVERYVDTNTAGEATHVLSGGTLALRATKTGPATAPYESGMLRSKFTFTPTATTSYYAVTRVLMPDVLGTWPAFWLAAGFAGAIAPQWPPEIDVMEAPLNGVEDTAAMTHSGAQIRGGLQTVSRAPEVTFRGQGFSATAEEYTDAASMRARWVTFGVVWTATGVCFAVDGVTKMCERYSWVDPIGRPANPATILLDLAVGGSWAGRHGVDDTGFPTQFSVDYVRVYAFDAQAACVDVPI